MHHANMSAIKMEGLRATAGNTFLTNLDNFCVNLVSTCLSIEVLDELCVSTGLGCLSALLLLLSCLLLVYQRCRYRRETPGETLTSIYSFFGNLCGTVGAILSSQLYIVIFLGAFAAALDIVHAVSCCCHLALCWNSQPERRRRMIRSRRRQHLLAICMLSVFGGGILKPWVTHRSTETTLSGRKLLHVIPEDNTEILGYMIGLLSLVISCTSRLPPLNRAYQGQTLTWAHVFSGLLSSLSGALYAAAILLYDIQLTSVSRVLPWLLSAICCFLLDLFILVICWNKRGARRQVASFSPDTEFLLGCPDLNTVDDTVMKKHRKPQVKSSAQTKTKTVPKTTEMDRYLDVSAQPANKVETLSKEEKMNQPLVQVIRFNSFYSSDSSFDSSLESSDLEWDFEEANAQWGEPTVQLQEEVKFPLREWPKHPKPCKYCICTMSRHPQKTLSGKNDNN
ncbi:Hypothetical predicted protein [Xyrichtys novacula]|uniref:Transmembrane protein 44 n=1 Tax=Xyrichtys novacula TaxID=13765 RepID=A0AAV1FJ99_XYRNO|nr:Hypothetical predicted protein [Xyrichtys novacula]